MNVNTERRIAYTEKRGLARGGGEGGEKALACMYTMKAMYLSDEEIASDVYESTFLCGLHSQACVLELENMLSQAYTVLVNLAILLTAQLTRV